MLICNKIKQKRKELKLTQKDVAAMLGVTFQQFQKYESGKSKISIDMLLKISNILNVDVAYLISDNIQYAMHSNNATYTDSITAEIIEKISNIQNRDAKISILGAINLIITIYNT